MPIDGRYISLGRCKGTMRMGSFVRVTFFAFRMASLPALLLAARFIGHLRPLSLSRIVPLWQTTDRQHSLCFRSSEHFDEFFLNLLSISFEVVRHIHEDGIKNCRFLHRIAHHCRP